jgi:hypothetical protein
MSTDSPSTDTPPGFRELLDYAEGRLSETEARRVAAYLASAGENPPAAWGWIQRFLAAAESVQFEEMPAGLEERLNTVYAVEEEKTPMETVGDWVANIRRVVAELVEPQGGPGLAAAGLRAQSFESATQQWAFKTDVFDIWVNILVRPDQTYDLHGQVFLLDESTGPRACSVQLVREDREFGLVSVDLYGEFVIKEVPSGEYALVITGEDIEVFCTPVRFGC